MKLCGASVSEAWAAIVMLLLLASHPYATATGGLPKITVGEATPGHNDVIFTELHQCINVPTTWPITSLAHAYVLMIKLFKASNVWCWEFCPVA